MRPALLVLLAGCGIVQRLDSNSAASSSSGIPYVDGERVGPYWGPDCVRIGAPTEPIRGQQVDADPTQGKQPNLSHDPADQILRLVCVDTIMSLAQEPHENTWVTQHFRFDEVFFDHFTAAMMMVQCELAGSCLRGPHVIRPKHAYAASYYAEHANDPPDVWQFYEAGMMRWYADRVDMAQVQKRLAELPLPAQAQAVYMRLVEQSRKDIVLFTDSLTPETKRIFVDVPVQTFERRQAEIAKSGKLLTELAALREQVKTERAAGAVSDDTVAKLVKLRIAYEATCKKDCTGGPIFAALTTQLFWSYVSRGDAPAATAEAKLLEKLDPSAAQEIADKQDKLIDEAQARLGRVKRAREQGIDADAARSTANGAIADFGNGNYVYRWHDDFKIHWASLIPSDKVGPIEGKVAAIDRRGNEATIRFRDEVSSWEESTGCYETGRIESIDRDGRITYREQCTGSTTKTERHKVPPVTMPASEVHGIALGDEVIGFTAFGPKQERIGGRVWVVKRGQKLVKLRDVPL